MHLRVTPGTGQSRPRLEQARPQAAGGKHIVPMCPSSPVGQQASRSMLFLWGWQMCTYARPSFGCDSYLACCPFCSHSWTTTNQMPKASINGSGICTLSLPGEWRLIATKFWLTYSLKMIPDLRNGDANSIQVTELLNYLSLFKNWTISHKNPDFLF